MIKRILCVLIIISMVLSMTACGAPKEKQFTVDELRITLNSSFRNAKKDGYSGTFQSSDIVVVVQRESKSDINKLVGEINMSDYENMALTGNASRNPSQVFRENGFSYLEYDYTDQDSKKTYSYFTSFHESDKAFWTLQFICLKDKYQQYKSQFIEYAASVSFDESVTPQQNNESTIAKILGMDLKSFSVRELSINLPKDFLQSALNGYTGYFYSNDGSACLAVLRESKEYIKSVTELKSVNLNKYHALLRDANLENDPSEIKTLEGIDYFEFTTDNQKESDFVHFMTVAESEKAFWTLHFFCTSDIYETEKVEFVKWASTVKMNEKDTHKSYLAKFTVEEMEMYLPSEFEELEADPEYEDAWFSSEDVDVYVTRYDRNEGETIDDLRNYIYSALEDVELKDGSWGDIKYLFYSFTEDGYRYDTYMVLYESDKALWIVEFFTDGVLTQDVLPEYEGWAESVKFN